MHINPTQEKKWRQLQQRLSNTWLFWGMFPLGVVIVLMLALAGPAVSANTSGVTQQEHIVIKHRAEAVLAVSALLFFVGFSLDGRWTDDERIGRHILRAAGGDQFRPTRDQLASHAEQAFRAVSRSVTMLTGIGLAMALLVVAAVVIDLPLLNAGQLLVLAAIFQVFAFSRHPYYSDLTYAAISGELCDLDEDNEK